MRVFTVSSGSNCLQLPDSCGVRGLDFFPQCIILFHNNITKANSTVTYERRNERNLGTAQRDGEADGMSEHDLFRVSGHWARFRCSRSGIERRGGEAVPESLESFFPAESFFFSQPDFTACVNRRHLKNYGYFI